MTRLTEQQDKALRDLADTIGRPGVLWQLRLIARVCLTLQGWWRRCFIS